MQRSRALVPLIVVACAIAGALPRFSRAWVEEHYVNGVYAFLQPRLTWFANLVPFALVDVIVILAAVAIIAWAGLAVAHPRTHALRSLARILTLCATLYLVFLVAWGMNFRRATMLETLPFSYRRVSGPSMLALGERAVNELNTLHATLPSVWPDWRMLHDSLAPAFERARGDIGPPWRVQLSRPKRSLFDLVLRRTAHNGAMLPPFAEVIVNQSLLPFERPYVLAHEWGHVTGRGNEAEASYVGWLTCMHGPPFARYSAWLRMYRLILPGLRPADAERLRARLAQGPRHDLELMRLRAAVGYSEFLTKLGEASQRVMRQVSRAPQGAGNYSPVIELILGLPFAAADTAR